MQKISCKHFLTNKMTKLLITGTTPHSEIAGIPITRSSFLWPPCVADADIIFLPCGFFLSFFSLPNLSGRRLDAYRIKTHDVALVRI